MEIKERLEELKKINELDPPKRKKGCSDCKKKPKEVIKLEAVIEDMFIPTQEQIKLAYAELTSLLGVKEEKKELIQKVYQYIFNEPFDFNCRACVNRQARRFRIYLQGK